ncbi:MAG TPA: hypothetical protein VHV74_00890 [Pseudonocardiaceae bacterium]|nr:hypothetical protein [Pseudonocardiaceae bacterium]
MSTNRPRRIDRRTAEQLLRGTPVDRLGDGTDAVADLLAAAAAPVREDELAGQPAALAAFRSARLGPVPQPRRRSVIKSALAMSLTSKIAALAAALVASGGVMAAAVTGHLAPHSSPGPTVAPATSSHGTAPHRPDTAGPTDPAGPSRNGQASHAAPAPDLVGLCHAYAARGGAPDNPAFTVLFTAAHGQANVATYCASLRHQPPGKPSTPVAHRGHNSTAHPGSASAHPAPHATAHPTPASGKGSHPSH